MKENEKMDKYFNLARILLGTPFRCLYAISKQKVY